MGEQPEAMAGATADPSAPTLQPSAPSEAGTPVLDSLFPTTVRRGETVTAVGSGFHPTSTLLLMDREVAPSLATDSQLTFDVPLDLAFESCEQRTFVAVRSADGFSNTLPLDVLLDPPTIASVVDEIVPGLPLTIDGANLSGASVSLGDHVVPLAESSPSTTTFEVPDDQPSGGATLRIVTACGSWEASVTVLPGVPAIVSYSPAKIAPGGIMTVLVKNGGPGVVTRALFDEAEVKEDDPTQFQWRPQTTEVLGVRVPLDLTLGRIAVRIESKSGMSEPAMLDVEGFDQATYPASSSDILFAPTREQLPGSASAFPIGTQGGAFPLRASPRWWYVLYAKDIDGAPDQSGPVCDGIGTIQGEERLYDHDLGDYLEALNGVPIASHSITGEATVTGERNEVILEIDRTSSGGAKEVYVGGWESEEAPFNGASSINAELVLTSQRTGWQLKIGHKMNGSTTPFPFPCYGSR